MPDAPLSRRARRTFEQEAADRAALNEPTLAGAPGSASGEIDTAQLDVAALSRRDRRRLERLARPLEAWTAEEEMLATGQIPVMTPERIAEQERISREKALKAAQEAESASQEFRRLAAADVRQVAPSQAQSGPQPVVQPVVQPGAQPGFPQTPTATDNAQAEIHAAAPNPSALEAPREPSFRGGQVDAPAPQEPSGGAAPTAAAGGYQPHMILDGEPLAHVVHTDEHHAARDAAVEPAAVEPAAVEPAAVDVAPGEPASGPTSALAPWSFDAERARVLQELFPPGSNQAALRQQDPFAPSATAVSAPASQEIPTLLPPQERAADAANPVDEIRRLAAEAMSGIERASRADEAAAKARADAPDSTAAAELDSWSISSATPSTTVDQVPSLPVPSQPVPSLPVPSQPTPLASPLWDRTAPPASEATFDGLGVTPTRESASPVTPPGGLAPHQASFDQAGQATPAGTYARGLDERHSAPASGQFPTQSGQFPTQSGQFPTQSGQFPTQSGQFPTQSGQFPTQSGQFPTQSGQFPTQSGQQPFSPAQAPAWAAQPPVPAQAATDPNDFKPVTDALRPDFSRLYQQSAPAPFSPVPGSIPTESTASGQTGTIRRPDLPDVGGAKHFKWLHLAVIGALMFVLGVVVYNVAFAQ